uniref:GATA zinc finger domain-containing protein 1 n=1 Tax=Pseudonaja textilis TaxID=8673 RepID=A0A670ZLS3_PSETE
MPLGLKPTCSVCRTTSSSMWKKGGQGEILCNNCTGRSGPPAAGAASYAGTSAASQHSNGGGGGGNSGGEIHRRSARLRNTKYKSAPAAEKKVSTKGKGRRHIFKLKNVRRLGTPVSVNYYFHVMLNYEPLFINHSDWIYMLESKPKFIG